MSQTNLCRLCVRDCNDYNILFDETGQQNDICEITLKYFHPMFLNVVEASGLAVLCLECCRHIKDFYNFQQIVYEARKNFLKNQRVIESKTETQTEIETCQEVILDHALDKSHNTVKQEHLELMDDLVSADNFKVEVSAINDNNSLLKSKNLQEFEDTKEINSIYNSDSDAISVSDTSESENDNESDDHEPTMKRKGERICRKDLDALIAQWRPTLECVLCEKALPSFRRLKKHFHDKDPEQRCRVVCCERRFSKRWLVAKHARFHLNPESFECEMCEYCHFSSNALYRHMRNEHKEHPDNSELRKKQSVECTLNVHRANNTIKSRFKSKPSIECVFCKIKYPNFCLLKQHFRKEHPDNECYVLCCKRKFARTNLFEQHIRLHLDPNAYKCKLCDKSLSRPDVLRAHMRRVHCTP